MKLKVVALGTIAALALTGCGAAEEGSTESYKIGIATIVSHPALDAVADGFKEAMAEAGYTEGENLTIDLQNAQGDQSTLTSIANTFASSDFNGYLAIATPTAQALANVITDKPIAFAAVTDPVAAGLMQDWDAPDANITGVSDLNPMDAQLDLIKEILPEAVTVGIVYSSGEVNSEVQVAEAEKAAESRGMEIKTATVTNSAEVQQAAESLDVDAYLIPTDNTVVSAAESLVQVAEQKSVPVFASDESTMERGATAGLSVNYIQQGKDAAAVLIKMLEGTPASDIPVETQKQFDLFVNEEAAAAQGIELPQAVVDRATKKF
ncbi:ABC transporter substrate-binding protein [Tessaracoccus sp. MC1865]|uniref:ABC transporter substrate-binding protein n=1 Tax=Tessaracoccus sp. MC1865 TaxID=2760310 RepID=UPI0016003471|nr:ABC transporter substrate-binding protein [Tessaracoccus sp. MC1865]MBB1483714.1 ABC transporter substrate-binding protein [Tessaracoccus sp. MC1865]QTO36783.1 ABC transporter substrate-binding protein [Tessaracoccus sp. MC1865]